MPQWITNKTLFYITSLEAFVQDLTFLRLEMRKTWIGLRLQSYRVLNMKKALLKPMIRVSRYKLSQILSVLWSFTLMHLS